MLIWALLALLTLRSLLKELTHWQLILVKDMEELALASLLAGILHPVHAHTLLALALLHCGIERPPLRIHIINAVLLVLLKAHF